MYMLYNWICSCCNCFNWNVGFYTKAIQTA